MKDGQGQSIHVNCQTEVLRKLEWFMGPQGLEWVKTSYIL